MYKNQYKPFKTVKDAKVYLENYIDLKNYTVISRTDLSELKDNFSGINIIDQNSDNPDRDIDQLDFDEGSRNDLMNHYENGEIIVFEGLNIEDTDSPEMDAVGEKYINVVPRDEYDTEVIDVNSGVRTMVEVEDNNPDMITEDEEEYFKKHDDEEEQFINR
ncbi:hypothetical protein J4760_05100 [Salinicoccus sp. ID82-1]|uniref:Uncharacterized protein n=1 Tax=Salinicoccus cyprini TaxID=2493691 RepID=A0A558AZU2_9STAP|nr:MULTISPECIES: hypothetical protein [Salinicoccus]MCG1009424.1 hypothetical protein [Salinicoccus sp. ID82-1]TVT29795.1 hypothetical protein FO441_05850 [Salinicoccus cyprini]